MAPTSPHQMHNIEPELTTKNMTMTATALISPYIISYITLYIIRKDIGLQSIFRKSIINLKRDLTVKLTNLS